MHKYLVLFTMVWMSVGLSACDIGAPETSLLEDQQSSVEQGVPFDTCGGFAGLECAEGFNCVDDPTDSCDPDSGGADCSGWCLPSGGGNGSGGANGNGQCAENPSDYIADAEQCLTLRFFCEPGQEAFFDDCGCGCRDIVGEACGDGFCGDGLECCNDSCGICVEPGGFCTQQVCDDGGFTL